jgi:hypothetical protein
MYTGANQGGNQSPSQNILSAPTQRHFFNLAFLDYLLMSAPRPFAALYIADSFTRALALMPDFT